MNNLTNQRRDILENIKIYDGTTDEEIRTICQYDIYNSIYIIIPSKLKSQLKEDISDLDIKCGIESINDEMCIETKVTLSGDKAITNIPKILTEKGSPLLIFFKIATLNGITSNDKVYFYKKIHVKKCPKPTDYTPDANEYVVASSLIYELAQLRAELREELQNRPITILSQDFKVSELKESSLYFINNSINCKKEDGSLLVNLYAGILILTGTGGEAQVFDSYNTYYVQDLSTGDWFNDDCNHITTQEVKDMLSDLGTYPISYKNPSTKKTTIERLSDFARNVLLKTMTLDSDGLGNTIKASGKYNICSRGIFRLGHPNAVAGFTPLNINVNDGDTIYLKFRKTDTECLCDIVYIGDIGKNIPDDVSYEYRTVDVWSGQLGFTIGATEYDSTLWQVTFGAQGTADEIDDYLRNLPCAKSGGLVYSTKEEFGRPELKAVTLGNGLKFENGVLSLDIENGDTLKYGTSTQPVETNENEV